jgi:hypothetical protein
MSQKSYLLPIVIIVASVVFAAWWVLDYQDTPSEPIKTSERVGYILAIESQDKNYSIQFDEVVLLTGEQAITTALRTGACTEATRNDCAPNDYFIDNKAALTTSLKLDRRPLVMRIEEGTSTLIESSLTDLLEDIEHGSYDLSEHLFNITLDEDMTVMNIEEIYLP